MKRYLILILTLCLLAVCHSTAQVNQINVGRFIRGWLILGPFSGRDIDQDYLESIGGEANVTPKIGDTVKTTQGETLTWNLYQSQGDIVDLLQAFGDHTNVMAYAFCYLQSKWGKDATIYGPQVDPYAFMDSGGG